MMPAGVYEPAGAVAQINNLPSFCLVAATRRPTTQSEIWMPQQNWNGRLLGTGNGGGAGSINYSSLAGGLRNGFVIVVNHTNKPFGKLAKYGEKPRDFEPENLHLNLIKALFPDNLDLGSKITCNIELDYS